MYKRFYSIVFLIEVLLINVDYLVEDASGLRRTKITESPLKNIFEMNLSLLTGLTFFLPFPVRGISVHISLTLEEFMKYM